MPPFDLTPLDAPNDSILSICSDREDFRSQESPRHDSPLVCSSEKPSTSNVGAFGANTRTIEPDRRLSVSDPSADQLAPGSPPSTVRNNERRASQGAKRRASQGAKRGASQGAKRRASQGAEHTPKPQSSERRSSRYFPRQNPREEEIKILQTLYFELLQRPNSLSKQHDESLEEVLQKLEERSLEEPQESQVSSHGFHSMGIDLLVEFCRRWPLRTPEEDRESLEPDQREQQEGNILENSHQGPEQLEQQNDQECRWQDHAINQSREQPGDTDSGEEFPRQDGRNSLHEGVDEYPIDLTSSRDQVEARSASSDGGCPQRKNQQQLQSQDPNDHEHKSVQTLSEVTERQRLEQQKQRLERKGGWPMATDWKYSDSEAQIPAKRARKSRDSPEETQTGKNFADLLQRLQSQAQAFQQQRKLTTSRKLRQQLAGPLWPPEQLQATLLQNMMRPRMNSGLLPVQQRPPMQMTQEELQRRLPPQTSLQRVDPRMSLPQQPELHRQSQRPQTSQKSLLPTQVEQSPPLSQVTHEYRLLQLLRQSPHLQLEQIQSIQQKKKRRRSSKTRSPQQQLKPEDLRISQKENDTTQGMNAKAGDEQKENFSAALQELLMAVRRPRNQV